MRAKEFEHFLAHEYRGFTGRSLGPRPAANAASRCRRIEKVLRIDLDKAIRTEGIEHVIMAMERAQSRFGFTSNARINLATLRTAVRYYDDFVEGRKKKPGRTSPAAIRAAHVANRS